MPVNTRSPVLGHRITIIKLMATPNSNVLNSCRIGCHGQDAPPALHDNICGRARARLGSLGIGKTGLTGLKLPDFHNRKRFGADAQRGGSCAEVPTPFVSLNFTAVGGLMAEQTRQQRQLQRQQYRRRETNVSR